MQGCAYERGGGCGRGGQVPGEHHQHLYHRVDRITRDLTHSAHRYLLQTGEVFQDKTNTNMFWFYPDFRTTVQAVSIPGLLPSNGTWNAAISTRKQMNKTSLYIGVQPVGPLTFPVF